MLQKGHVMAYEDVPERLINGEAVPRSEIIGYNGSTTDLQTTYCLNILVMATLMVKVFEDDTVKYQITPFGQAMRQDFLVRIFGDCPECP